MITSHALEALNDQALLSRFGDLLRRNHECNANLLRHIDAIDRRQLWAKLGYSSLFGFLVNRHHMSESTAGKRIGAARTARRFPVLFAMVARGEIHLSGIHRLTAHLTPENHERVLADAKHRTIRQIEELVARLAPHPDVPSTLRALPTRTTALAPALASPALASPALASPALASPALTSASPAPSALPAPPAPMAFPPLPVPRRSPDPAPLSPGRYKLQVTLGENARNKLKQLQDLLAHQIPNGDPAAIVERALDALLTQVYKRKAGITDKPQAQKPKSKPTATATATATTATATKVRRTSATATTATATKVRRTSATATTTATATKVRRTSATATTATKVRRTRYIRVDVRREVWRRDEGRCGFVGDDGHRCNESRGVEVAHVHAWGKGGANTANNLGLRCQAHNAWEADRDYGTSHMASKRARKLLKVRESVARYSVRRGCCAITARVLRSQSRCGPPRLSAERLSRAADSSSFGQAPGGRVGGRSRPEARASQANLRVCVLAGNSASAKKKETGALPRCGPNQFRRRMYTGGKSGKLDLPRGVASALPLDLWRELRGQ